MPLLSCFVSKVTKAFPAVRDWLSVPRRWLEERASPAVDASVLSDPNETKERSRQTVDSLLADVQLWRDACASVASLEEKILIDEKATLADVAHKAHKTKSRHLFVSKYKSSA
jgi:hypothetical protein